MVDEISEAKTATRHSRADKSGAKRKLKHNTALKAITTGWRRQSREKVGLSTNQWSAMLR